MRQPQPGDALRRGPNQGVDEVCTVEQFPLSGEQPRTQLSFPLPEEQRGPLVKAAQGSITVYDASYYPALEKFAEDVYTYQTRKGKDSFGTTWKYVGQYFPQDLYIYQEGGVIVAALWGKIEERSGKKVFSISQVETLQYNGGIKLLRHAVEMSSAAGLDGVIGKPASQAINLYIKYGAVPFEQQYYILEKEKFPSILSRLPK